MKKNDALYMTIYHFLLRNIQNGSYAQGERLPTEMELAKEFYVSRITSKKALNALAEEGIIIRIPGRGSYVKENCNIPVVQYTGSLESKNIALIMGGYSSSFGLDIINGAMDTAETLGLNLIIKATYSSQEKEAQSIKTLLSSGVAGIIVQPSQGELYSETILKLIYEGYPVVMIDRNMQGINAPFVGVDNKALSQTAVEHLINNGHKDIALISLADENSSTINERMIGYTNAFVDRLMVVNKGLWLTGINERLSAADMNAEDSGAYEFYVDEIAMHLARHPEITAVFGTEYCVSKATYDAVKRIKKHVPEDISVVSFDMDSSYIGSHNMSYIKQPQHEMGKRSVEILYELIQKHPLSQIQWLLQGEWIDANSIRQIKS